MSYSSTISGFSPTAWWRFDDSSGATAADASGNSHPGTLGGTFTLSQSSLVNDGSDHSIAFSGANGSEMTCTTLPSIGTGDFTVLCWVKLASPSGVQVAIANTGAFGWLGVNGSGNPQSSLAGAGSSNVADGSPHLLAVTRTAGTIKLYSDNGVLEASASDSSNFSAGTLEVGNFGGGFGFGGTIDEPAVIVGTALTQANLQAIYAAGTAGGAATTLTLTGPTSGVAGVASTNFTATPNGSVSSDTVTPHTAGTGTFSPTSLTFTSSSAPQTFTYTPTTTAGSPHSISITDSAGLTIAGSPIAYTVTAGPVTITMDDAAVFLSPYNWIVSGSSYAQTSNTGAYLKVKFTGTSASLSVSIPSTSTPEIAWSVDGGAFIRQALTSSDTSVSLATGLSSGTHTLLIVVVALNNAIDRWTTPVSRIRLAGLVLDGGAGVSAPTTYADNMLVFSDSNGEGWNATGSGNYAYNDASLAFPFLLGRMFECEVGIVCYASQGYITAASAANVPALTSAWDHYSSGVSRLSGGLLSPVPKHILSGHGENDSGDVTSAVAGLIAAWRAAAPAANLAFLAPASGTHLSEIAAGVSGSGDAKASFVPTGESMLVGEFSEFAVGLHLSQRGHARYASVVGVAYQALIDERDAAPIHPVRFRLGSRP